MNPEGKRITVVGMARSGVGAANLLDSLGASVTVTDIKTGAELAPVTDRLRPSVKTVLGSHPDHLFLQADLIVVSPGVPLQLSPLQAARTAGIPVIGELELAYQVIRDSYAGITPGQEGRTVPFLAVTGSNGKSTTTSLLDYMLRRGGFTTVLGGNIGQALSEEIISLRKDRVSRVDAVVLEVSSFQLETIDRFRPHIASILNITPDHMDRYQSLEEYRDAKARMFLNQKDDDFLVVNADDPGIAEALGTGKKAAGEGPRIVFFSRTREVEGIFLRNGIVVCNLPAVSPAGELISAGEIRIKGVHNLENAMAASAMALLAGCPPGAVIQALKEFEGLEHRLEYVREIDGVQYINDSKGTNVGAVIKSIESFVQPLILIAGGRDKAGDFSALRDLVAARVKAVVLIGEAAGKIRGSLQDVCRTVVARDLRDAVAISRSLAEKGDVVLLSPACASFDMFRDFEDRGRQFKELVTEIKPNA